MHIKSCWTRHHGMDSRIHLERGTKGHLNKKKKENICEIIMLNKQIKLQYYH